MVRDSEVIRAEKEWQACKGAYNEPVTKAEEEEARSRIGAVLHLHDDGVEIEAVLDGLQRGKTQHDQDDRWYQHEAHARSTKETAIIRHRDNDGNKACKNTPLRKRIRGRTVKKGE